MSEISDLQNLIGETNGRSGFNQAEESGEEYWDRKLLLVVSEIVEAQEELRHGHAVDEHYYSYPDGDEGPAKPEGFDAELADAVIRIFGIAYEARSDLDTVIREKVDYNGTRAFRHGKSF